MNDIVEAVPARSPNREAVVLARKSWVAYVGRLVGAVVILPIVTSLLWQRLPLLAVALALIIVAGMVYTVALERSYELFMDDQGIWLRRGILPWSRGVSGVKWRDLDSATYFTGFISWLTKSYTVRLEHRFTKANEILISHMSAGNKAVEAINDAHAEMIRRAG
ncbi:hypothetical protein [Burkholderia cenocepacia]|uniref:hypothetical protein n=1 Tax=Burkholderia cenocepacia TaxID=95486 RepID=UPI002B254123|nr:hypothetical protein [Burkholderia cenocepacia]MEB2558805.1 hypothetical protein [Burkholderia cenocepacia]